MCTSCYCVCLLFAATSTHTAQLSTSPSPSPPYTHPPTLLCCVLQTSRSQLLFYGLQQTAEQVVPGLPSYVAVQPYVKEHAYLPHNAPPLALAADARSVLVAHTDGCVSTTTWNGKVGLAASRVWWCEQGDR
jgi:hypothetical protein